MTRKESIFLVVIFVVTIAGLFPFVASTGRQEIYENRHQYIGGPEADVKADFGEPGREFFVNNPSFDEQYPIPTYTDREIQPTHKVLVYFGPAVLTYVYVNDDLIVEAMEQAGT